MIVVTTNRMTFSYDIHSLVQAFFPERKVRVCEADEMQRPDAGIAGEEACFIRLDVIFDEETIHLSINHRERSSVIAAEAPYDALGTRLSVKNSLKQLIYRTLSEHTGKTLPWGALTGIRPAKIPQRLIEAGYSDEEIFANMAQVYYCSEEKARLALNVARREQAILGKADYRNGYSLYIGIPFCPTTCLYCSFASYPLAKWQGFVEEYLHTLFSEIEVFGKKFSPKALYSIYIGGGTPTALSAHQLERLLVRIADSFNLSAVEEYTVEAGRPDSIDSEKLAILGKYGVSRISINPQSMNEKTLRLIGRNHTPGDVRNAFRLAREMNFSNINMDLIIGLPEETLADIEATMQAISCLGPDSLTVHSLSVKRAAKLTDWVNEKGKEALYNTEEIVALTSDCAQAMNMSPYYLYRQKNTIGNFENVGYAKAGREGLYNILMMEDICDILALGAGAISKRVFDNGDTKRQANLKDLKQYLERMREMIGKKAEFFS